jgi:hypothetical protein
VLAAAAAAAAAPADGATAPFHSWHAPTRSTVVYLIFTMLNLVGPASVLVGTSAHANCLPALVDLPLPRGSGGQAVMWTHLIPFTPGIPAVRRQSLWLLQGTALKPLELRVLPRRTLRLFSTGAGSGGGGSFNDRAREFFFGNAGAALGVAKEYPRATLGLSIGRHLALWLAQWARERIPRV